MRDTGHSDKRITQTASLRQLERHIGHKPNRSCWQSVKATNRHQTVFMSGLFKPNMDQKSSDALRKEEIISSQSDAPVFFYLLVQ